MACDPVLVDIQAKFKPDLDDLTAAQFDALAEVAAFFVSESAWTDDAKCKYARELIIAHLFKITGQSSAGTTGPITSMKTGQLSVGFGSAGTDSDFNSTVYGKLYLSLVLICFPITIDFC